MDRSPAVAGALTRSWRLALTLWRGVADARPKEVAMPTTLDRPQAKGAKRVPKPVRGQIDIKAFHARTSARFPKILAKLAE